MQSLYVAVYSVASTVPRSAASASAGFIEAVRRRKWPYDVGDDPSFFCSRELRGALTWGICRQPIRCAVQPGDIIVFFGRLVREGGWDYYMSGYGTVKEKVTHIEIWRNARLAVYRKYLNLLVTPGGQAFRHHETHPGKCHEDWLWRLVCRKGHSWKKRPDFDAFVDKRCTQSFRPGQTRAGNGEPILPCENYVIFEKSNPATFVVDRPPIVARFEKSWGPRTLECWDGSSTAQSVKALTIARKQHRGLKTRASPNARPNYQAQNPSIHVSAIDPVTWVGEMSAALCAASLRPVGGRSR